MATKQPRTPLTMTDEVRRMMRKEFTDFFYSMASPTRDWPDIPPAEVIEAAADALIEVARRKAMPPGSVQTLLLEMLDRINKE